MLAEWTGNFRVARKDMHIRFEIGNWDGLPVHPARRSSNDCMCLVYYAALNQFEGSSSFHDASTCGDRPSELLKRLLATNLGPATAGTPSSDVMPITTEACITSQAGGLTSTNVKNVIRRKMSGDSIAYLVVIRAYTYGVVQPYCGQQTPSVPQDHISYASIMRLNL